MKKKLLALALCVAMFAVAVVSGTLAYFSDYEYDLNVMTVGTMDIVQNEYDADGNPFNEDIFDAKPIVPAVYDDLTDSTAVENPYTKTVTVTNNANIDIYARTLVAFEDSGDITDLLHFNYDDCVTFDPAAVLDDVVINGTKYAVVTLTYNEKIARETESCESLQSFFFDKTAEDEDFAEVGEDYDILVISQAVQADGFADPTVALDAAFGEVNAASVAEWFVDYAA